jgi:PAS domain S-box-containing protein
MLSSSIVNARQAELLAWSSQHAEWPQWVVDETSRACVLLNDAARRWLGPGLGQSPQESDILLAIQATQANPDERLASFSSGSWDDVPLRRQWARGRWPLAAQASHMADSLGGVWWELTGLLLITPAGRQLHCRVRPIGATEAALLHGSSLAPDALRSQVSLDDFLRGEPSGVALCEMFAASGELRWTYADGLLASLRSVDPADTMTTDPCASVFDALLLRAALGLRTSARWTLMLRDEGGDSTPWLLAVVPRADAKPGSSYALLTLHALPKEAQYVSEPARPAIARGARQADAHFLCRADGTLCYLSDAWVRLTGHSVDQALQRPLTQFCPLPVSTQGLSILAPMLLPGAAGGRVEWPFVHADGSLRWLEVRVHPGQSIERPGHTGFSGTLTDITERYRANRIRQIVETALEHTVNGVVITDATQAHNPIVYVNGGFTQITGYSAEDVLGINCSFLQGNERDQAGVTTLREAIRSRHSAVVQLRNFRKDGTRFWNQVEINPVQDPVTGVVTHFFALQTDVTLKRQAEDAAMLKTLELERAFSGNPLGMVTFDEAGCIRLLSPASLRLLGLQAQDMVGLSVTDLIAKVAKTRCVAASELAWPTDKQPVMWEFGGADTATIEVTLSALGDSRREQIALFRDATTEQARQASQSQFLATAAHELRTPMGSIRGFTELMLMRNYTQEQAKPMLETVLKQSMRLSAILNDLLDLSQMEAMGGDAFVVGPVDLGEVMKHATKVVLMPGSDRLIDIVLPREGLMVQGNATKLEQVLINLLSNAIKYSPDGGAVTAGVRLGEVPGWCSLFVTDQGLGLSEAHQAKLFTRFFRANPGGAIPGTGLGLVIVKELVERMGGRIEVQSQLGAGTTFTIHLRTSEAALTLGDGLLFSDRLKETP